MLSPSVQFINGRVEGDLEPGELFPDEGEVVETPPDHLGSLKVDMPD